MLLLVVLELEVYERLHVGALYLNYHLNKKHESHCFYNERGAYVSVFDIRKTRGRYGVDCDGGNK